MSYFDISLTQMSDQPSIFAAFARKAQLHLFHYSGRQEPRVHQSTVSDRTLFYFRLFAFILLTVIYVWTIAVIQQSLMENIMYLTMMGYLLAWLYFGLVLQDYCMNEGGKPISKKLHQYIEIFHELALCTELPITLVFWGVLFKLVLNMAGVTTEIIVINGFLHSAPLVLLAVDFMLNSFCFHINHVPVVIVFDVAYLLINMVYSLAVKPIYGPIDWVTLGSYIIAVASIVLTLLVHFIGRVVHRRWKAHRLTINQHVEVPLLAPEGPRSSMEVLPRSNSNPIVVQNRDL